MFANCILFVTFCSMGTLVRRKKTWRYSGRKVLELGLLMRDISVYVSCKFEMYIFKTALVISENVRIAFLYVLSIYSFSCMFHLTERYYFALSHISPAPVAQVLQHQQRLSCLVLSDIRHALASLLLYILSLANKSEKSSDNNHRL